MRHIIVDGYNVIRADPRLLSHEQVSLEQARDMLVRTLASSPRLVNDRVTVVFDGTHGYRDHVHAGWRGRIEMLYSARGQTADDVIVAQARAHVGGERVVVVSNDAEVRDRCRLAGCEVSGSENLLGQLPGRMRSTVREREEDPVVTRSTVKRGNPRRASKRTKKQPDIRF